MPHRLVSAWAALLGIAGILVVAVLLLLGKDLSRASVTGPRWKRRLVAAAMAMLGLLGAAEAGEPASAPASRPASSAPAAPTPLRESKDWKEISYAWLRNGAHASVEVTRRGGGSERRDALLSLLPRVERLRRSGALTPAEADAVKMELTVLADAVYLPPPEEPEGSMTEEQGREYWRERNRAFDVNLTPACESVPRAKRRIASLEALAQSSTVRREVYLHLLATVAPEAVLLRKNWGTKPGQEKSEGDRLADQLDALLTRIRDRTPPTGDASDVRARSEWKEIEATWWLGKRVQPISEADKKVVTARIARVPALADHLKTAGLLNRNEAALLKIEPDRLEGEVGFLPTFESVAMCYLPSLPWISRDTLTRLQTRLELLAALQKTGRIRPALLAKAVGGLRWDIEILSSRVHMDALDPPDREKARQALGRANALLKQLAPDAD